ncbi:MAG: hypothetical protein OJF62_002995 [Pseudolabrys sp.]|jgi:hypothetical protein|nr:hypothetical protein [Pseudolabrys sp.]
MNALISINNAVIAGTRKNDGNQRQRSTRSSQLHLSAALWRPGLANGHPVSQFDKFLPWN